MIAIDLKALASALAAELNVEQAGSPWMRWALIEAAIHQFRRQDDFGRWARHLAIRKGMLKARVGVARALCDELFDAWPRA